LYEIFKKYKVILKPKKYKVILKPKKYKVILKPNLSIFKHIFFRHHHEFIGPGESEIYSIMTF